MNLLLSCIGKRAYLADYFRQHLVSGERIIGTSNTPWTAGFSACDRGLLMPSIASDEYIPAMLEACRVNEVAGLVSLYDPDVVALSAHADEFRAIGVTPVIPTPSAATIGFDKWLTFQTLSAAGFDVPDTAVSLDVARNAIREERWRFPLVVKPRRGFGSANVFVARDDQQLAAFFSYAPDMLIQEFIEGEPFDIEVLSDTGARVLEVVAWRKHLSRMGETEHAITVHDNELLQLGQRLAEELGLIGPMDVDLFRTSTGKYVVLELNLRFGGGYPVSHLAGAQFPRHIVEMARGVRPEPRIGHYQADVCLVKGLAIMGGPASTFLDDLRTGRQG